MRKILAALQYLKGDITLNHAEELALKLGVSDGIKFIKRCKINDSNVKKQTLLSLYFRSRLHLGNSPLKYRRMRDILHMELFFNRTTKKDILLALEAVHEKETVRRKKDKYLEINLEECELIFRPLQIKHVLNILDVNDDFTMLDGNLKVIIPDEAKFIDAELVEEGK